MDVHARDVVQRLIDERAESSSAFGWASQLRYSQNEKTRECQVWQLLEQGLLLWRAGATGAPQAQQLSCCSPCTPPQHTTQSTLHPQVDICDASIAYGGEYIGNLGCLCITPLTDRCYITLTQAQRLVLGACRWLSWDATAAGQTAPFCSRSVSHSLSIPTALCSTPPPNNHPTHKQVALPRALPAPARRRRPRTWRARWACSATYSTALTRWTTRPWARSSRGWRRRGPGLAWVSSAAVGVGRLRSVGAVWGAGSEGRCCLGRGTGADLPCLPSLYVPVCRRVQPHPGAGAVGVLHTVQGAAGVSGVGVDALASEADWWSGSSSGICCHPPTRLFLRLPAHPPHTH